MCCVCSNVCGDMRYDNVEDTVKQVWTGELTICEDCYTSGKIPMHWNSDQFVLQDNSVRFLYLFCYL